MSTSDSRPGPIRPHDLAPAHTWVVDAANVIGSRPDGWWRDRAGAAARLRRQISELLSELLSDAGAAPAAAPPEASAVGPAGAAGQGAATSPRPLSFQLPDQVILVLEGAARAGVAATPPTAAQPTPRRPPGPTLVVVHAAGAGDDTIAEQAALAPRPVLVFTSDRGLRDRVKAAGAEVAGSGALTRLLPKV